jgi:Arc/MetJ-type ribon-helix-helix transcriptional regulator
MTIHLPDDLAESVRVEVRRGQFASEDEVVAAAVRDYLGRRHGPVLPAGAAAPAPAGEELSAEELQRRLCAAGVIGEIKPPITDLTPYTHRQAVPVQGEPLSETVLRERR